MICAHIPPETELPTWLLHLESLTLARFVRTAEGHPCLISFSKRPPSDQAYREFVHSLPALLGEEPDSSPPLPMITYLDASWRPPSILVFSPVETGGFVMLHTEEPQFAFGHANPDVLIGPVWSEQPTAPNRDELIRSLFAATFNAAGADYDADTVAPWILRPDEVAIVDGGQ